MKEIIIASKNIGKIAEYRAMLEPLGFWITSLLDHEGFPDIAETGTTFAENAMLKAMAVSGRFAIPCLADDSGLEVKALHGAPGVRSQRYSPEGSQTANNRLLIRNLTGEPDRAARFVCTIVYYSQATGFRQFDGSVTGEIVDEPKGHEGFGYDPHFFLPSLGKTMGELPIEAKNAISHRGMALKKLMVWLAGEPR
jgi:XTP/dITP diphosphohydrolase